MKTQHHKIPVFDANIVKVGLQLHFAVENYYQLFWTTEEKKAQEDLKWQTLEIMGNYTTLNTAAKSRHIQH